MKNYNTFEVTLEVELRFGADFADIFEVRGMASESAGDPAAPSVRDGVIEFAHTGRDDVRRLTRIRFGTPPARIDVDRDVATVSFQVHLEANQTKLLTLSVEPLIARGGRSGRLGLRPRGARAPSLVRGVASGARPRSSRTTSCSTSCSTAACVTSAPSTREVDDGGVLAAGIPWYVTIFGRDALIASHQLLMVNTQPAREALELLAARQGVEVNDWRDEQPGKILHEVRRESSPEPA